MGDEATNHDRASEILDFWFEELTEARWWKKDPELDSEIAFRFGDLRDSLLATEAAGWRSDPDRMLAAIIALDQFSRNIHRGEAEAFAADDLALELTREAIEKGWDEEMERDRRFFLYMPLMHSEDLDDQRESVRRFDAMSADGHDKFAHLHHDQIERFGRFPGRNAALGRETTAEEQAALDDGAAF